ncbi:maleylpyruvate isomerase family mycothiol-dependent enzyme [Haloechinothrix salitolerans]|uniref:Maleylpyruvate isomerase family mycothiol-dependent enzyme n=1 Tax=Haloechinothrix salitolerans TaxID=926830 RepID=A0ABW2BW06_9PSEU
MTSEPTIETLLGWVERGQRQFEDAVAALPAAAATEASALPGWTRGHVITHVARNADALVNLLTWADTGTPTPMYATPTQRDDDIEAGAGRALAEQLDDLRESGRRFAATAAALSTNAWQTTVRNAQGVEMPASKIPWFRTREVWLHLVDLGAGPGVDVIPDDVAAELVRDVATWMSPKLDQAASLRPEGHLPVPLGPDIDTPTTIAGPANRIAGWLVGRADASRLRCEGSVPDLPRWL